MRSSDQEESSDSNFTGTYFSLGSKTKKSLFHFHYDATKLLKPEWRWYILTYSYPKWPDEGDGQKDKKEKQLKTLISTRIHSILQVIGLNKKLPSLFYGFEGINFSIENTRTHGIRNTASLFDGEYYAFEQEYK